jgi:hypothetical protein
VKPEEIELKNLNKIFEYEKQCRFIDKLSYEELKKFSKLYCKLYLYQSEVLSSLL